MSNENLNKQTYVAPNINIENQFPEKALPDKKEGKFKKKKKDKKKRGNAISKSFKKIISRFAIFFGLIFGIVIVYGAAFFLDLDLEVVNLNFTGTVVDDVGNPIPNARVNLNGNQAIADSSGTFRYENINPQTTTIEIEASDHVRITEEVNIRKGFLDYDFNKEFILNSSVSANLSGNFLADSDYDFEEDLLFVGDLEINLNSDGTFSSRVSTGFREFNFRSDRYKDIKQEVEIKPGSNFLDNIELEESAEVVAENKDYITDAPVENITLAVEGIPQDQIKIDSQEIRISDLDIGKEYNIRIEAPGYQTRNYTITPIVGENQLFDFRLVPNGQAYYLRKPEDSREYLAFRSEFDGKNEKDITPRTPAGQNNIENIFTLNDRIYFISEDYDRISNANGGSADLLYEIILDGQEELRVENTDNLPDVFYFLNAGRAVNIREIETPLEDRLQLEIMNLDGTAVQIIDEFRQTEILQVLLDDELSRIVTLQQNENDKTISIVSTDLDSQISSTIVEGDENLRLWDISSDGSKIIYTTNDSSQNFTDLILRDLENAEKRSLITNELGRDYQFVVGSDNDIVYVDRVDNKDTLFRLSIEQNRTTEMFNLTAQDNVADLYQQGDKFYYVIEDKGLYVFDVLLPKSYRLVVEGEVSINIE